MEIIGLSKDREVAEKMKIDAKKLIIHKKHFSCADLIDADTTK